MKQEILEGSRYKYSFDRDLHFKWDMKKAFSVGFVEDRSEAELKRRIDGCPGAE